MKTVQDTYRAEGVDITTKEAKSFFQQCAAVGDAIRFSGSIASDLLYANLYATHGFTEIAQIRSCVFALKQLELVTGNLNGTLTWIGYEHGQREGGAK